MTSDIGQRREANDSGVYVVTCVNLGELLNHLCALASSSENCTW